MSYTMEDFRNDYVKEHLKDLSLEDRLAGVPKDELLKFFSPDEIQRYVEKSTQQPGPRKSKRRDDVVFLPARTFSSASGLNICELHLACFFGLPLS